MSHPCSMIVLASEQVWPNLVGVWRHRDRIERLYILHTHSEPRSKRPATRFRSLIERICCSLKNQVHLVALESALPEVLQAAIRKLLDGDPAADWIVNATGGLKLMSFGLADLVGHDRVRVLYRELEDGWYELSRQQGQIVATKATLDDNIADEVDVIDLVKIQFPGTNADKWQNRAAEALDVPRLVELGIRHQWTWPSVAESYGLALSDSKGGIPFELFVGACLRAMGLNNLVLNLKLEREGSTTFEVDCVLAYRDRLVIVDCKLTDDEQIGDSETHRHQAMVTEIHDASQRNRALGGLRSQTILMRPSRPRNDRLREIAEAHQIQLWDESDNWSFFSKLANFLGLELPAALRRADQAFQQERDHGRRVLSMQRSHRRAIQFTPKGDFLDVGAMTRDEAQLANRHWRGMQMDGRVYITFSRRDCAERKALETVIRNWLADFVGKSDPGAPQGMREIHVHLSKIGNTVAVDLPLAAKVRAELYASLQAGQYPDGLEGGILKVPIVPTREKAKISTSGGSPGDKSSQRNKTTVRWPGPSRNSIRQTSGHISKATLPALACGLGVAPDGKVKVKIIEQKISNKGRHVYIVKELGALRRGLLSHGTAPATLPEIGSIIEVYRVGNGNYGWDPPEGASKSSSAF